MPSMSGRSEGFLVGSSLRAGGLQWHMLRHSLWLLRRDGQTVYFTFGSKNSIIDSGFSPK